MFVSKIKKCLSGALCALLLCTTIPTGIAEAATGFTVNVGSVKGNVGEQVIVPVNFESVPSNGITAADMKITYDSNKLEYVNGAAGSIVTNPSTNFAINKEKDGSIKALFLDYTMSNGAINSNGAFANITFKVKNSGSATVSVTNATFGDNSLKSIDAQVNAGAVSQDGSTQPSQPTQQPWSQPTQQPSQPTSQPWDQSSTGSGFTVSVSSVKGNVGEQVTMPVNFANVPSSGITTADMTITYDSNKLEYVDGVAGSIVTNPSTNFAINKESDGTIKALFLDYTMSNGAISSNGVFLNLKFKVKNSGTANVKVNKATFGDKNLSNIKATINAGAVSQDGSTPSTQTSQPQTQPTQQPGNPTQNPPQSSGGNCSVSYSQNAWGTGATVSLTVKNNSSSPVDGWKVNFTYSGNQKITNAWNCSYTQNGSSVTISSVSHTASIPAGGSVTAGFNISYSGTNDAPTNFTVNSSAGGSGSTQPSQPTQQPWTQPTPQPTQQPTQQPWTQPTPQPTQQPWNPTQNPPQSSEGSYSVNYSQNSWGSGATVSFTVKNNSSSPVDGWKVSFTYSGDQKITNAWNCSYTQSGSSVTISNASYNASIPAGGSVTAGFNISYSGTNDAPTNFIVNSIPTGSGTSTQPPQPTQKPTAQPTATQKPSTGSGFTVSVASVKGSVGEQVVVPVNFTNVPSSGISTADMTIAYDSNKLEYVSGEAGSIVTNPTTNFAINKESDGSIKVLFLDYTMADGYISSNGVFVNLKFKVKNSGTANVKVTKATFGDKNLSSISAKLNAGAVSQDGSTQPSQPTQEPWTQPTATQKPWTQPTQQPSTGSGFTVNVASVKGSVGEQVVVPVSFANVPSSGISTADMTIAYDSNKLEYVGGEAGSIVTNPTTNFAINKESDGSIKVLFLDYTLADGYISSNGVFVNLTFKVKNSGTANVKVTSATFGDKNLSSISTKLNAGAVSQDGSTQPSQPTQEPWTQPTATQKPWTQPTQQPSTGSGFTVSVASVKGSVGEQVVVPVNFANVPSSGISAADMTITYDSNKLEYVGGEAGSIVTNPTTNFAINKESDGSIKALFLDYTMADGYISSNGVFVNLTFKVKNSGTANVKVTSATFGDKNLSSISAKLNAGAVSQDGSTQPSQPTQEPWTQPTAQPTATQKPWTQPTQQPSTGSGFTVNVASVKGSVGEQVVVPVSFANVPSSGISTADMTIAYDSNKLEYVGGEAGSIVTNPTTNFAINKESDGSIKVLFLDYTMADGYISSNGVFVNLTFKVKNSGTANVKATSATFGDKNLSSISTKLNAGAVSQDGSTQPSQPTQEPWTQPTQQPWTQPTQQPSTGSGFTVNVASVKGSVGEEIVVPVNFANVPSNGISTADMTITYDSNKLEYVSGEAGSIVTNPTTNFAINKASDGSIKALFLDYTMSTGYITSNGVFVNLKFKVKNSGNAAVKLTNSTFGDKDLSSVNAKINEGTVSQ